MWLSGVPQVSLTVAGPHHKYWDSEQIGSVLYNRVLAHLGAQPCITNSNKRVPEIPPNVETFLFLFWTLDGCCLTGHQEIFGTQANQPVTSGSSCGSIDATSIDYITDKWSVGPVATCSQWRVKLVDKTWAQERNWWEKYNAWSALFYSCLFGRFNPFNNQYHFDIPYTQARYVEAPLLPRMCNELPLELK